MMMMMASRTHRPAKAGMSLFVVLLVLSSCWISNARELTTSTHLSGEENEIVKSEKTSETGKVDLCTLCEQFSAEAVIYLSENKTQTQIIEILHKSCSRLVNLKQQCVTLVDYYAPFFFLEIETIQPDTFCQKVNLCNAVSEDKCEVCHHVIDEALTKLKDPDTQLEVIELLLKACNAVKGRAKKCKRMVLEYGPLVFANANHFLEEADICTLMHACPSSFVVIKQQPPLLSENASLTSSSI
ncbi:prosaposin-like isoform X2 [Impatiens glandulifera]|uniref:prosaposin-like isoform X2 n=1 Tax=Impatiens glandulifera TaxID=253017 RepID=UPI001FB0BB49|nr:prosaposin-like isoform X2 [Impatiens glandulifera]